MISRNENLIVWRRTQNALNLAARCAHCDGVGSILTRDLEREDCAACSGRGWFGIDPRSAASADPGSVEKVAVLGVRYASGEPLWNNRDQCASETLMEEEPAPQEESAPQQVKSRRTQHRRKRQERTHTPERSVAGRANGKNRRTTSLVP